MHSSLPPLPCFRRSCESSELESRGWRWWCCLDRGLRQNQTLCQPHWLHQNSSGEKTGSLGVLKAATPPLTTSLDFFKITKWTRALLFCFWGPHKNMPPGGLTVQYLILEPLLDYTIYYLVFSDLNSWFCWSLPALWFCHTPKWPRDWGVASIQTEEPILQRYIPPLPIYRIAKPSEYTHNHYRM